MNNGHSNFKTIFTLINILVVPLLVLSQAVNAKENPPNYLAEPEKFDCNLAGSSFYKCSLYFEKIFIKAYKNQVKRTKKGIEFTLLDGSKKLEVDARHMITAMELSPKGRFITMREQFEEGNGWSLFDLATGEVTDMFGYPLFSEDESRFVSLELDLEAGFSPNTLDIYLVTESGVKKVFKGINEKDTDTYFWGPSDVKWLNNQTIYLNKTTFNEAINENENEELFIKEPALLEEDIKGEWHITLKK